MNAAARSEHRSASARGRVALLQNQSEMRHNAWADARNQLRELRYEWSLFTSESVEELAGALARKRFDALVIGSNAFNDQTIRATLEAHSFCKALHEFLSEGRGLIVLHQMGHAFDGAELSMLPAPWDKVSLEVRQEKEAAIRFAGGAQTHPVMRFPEVVDPARIVEHARVFSPLQASWFHSWSGVTQDAWTPLLRAAGDAGDDRALVALARDPDGRRRIVLCAPPADWQRPPALLPNLLYYACRGSLPAAIIGSVGGSPGLDLVETWLASERVPFEHYDASRLDRLHDRLSDRVHETVLLGPGVDFDQFDDGIRSGIEDALLEGRLRLLGYGESIAGRRRLWIASSRLSVAEAIAPLEAQAVAALDNGRVDGSFWSTVETLEVLQALAHTATKVDRDLAAPAIADAMSRVRNECWEGSYDDTPAATCGLLWLLDTFKDPRAARTEAWLRTVAERDTHDAFPGEAIMALTTLALTRRSHQSDAERLDVLLDSAAPLDELRDHDLLIAIHAAEVSGNHESAEALAIELISRQDDESGGWVDLETTATIVRRLAALSRRTDAVPGLEQSLVRASFHIRHAARLDREVPWADRISTSLLCVHALGLVNEILDIPIGDTVDAVRRDHQEAEFRNTGEAAARAAEALRQSNETLRGDLESARNTAKAKTQEAAVAVGTSDAAKAQLRRTRRWRNWLWIALAAALYLCAALVTAAAGNRPGTVADLIDDFANGIPIHVTVLGVLLGVGIGVEQIIKRE